jgi:hypothetical protein
MAVTEGTMRKQNTRSTPAIATPPTPIVTTTPHFYPTKYKREKGKKKKGDLGKK